MKVSLIYAVSDNGVIGRDNDLPWRLSADLKRFKRLTMGHHLVMGRRTFASLGRALPGRTTIVLSRGRPALPEGVRLAGSISEAVDIARTAGEEEVFVAGGAEVFRQSIGLADRLYVTRVRAEVEGDVVLPELTGAGWRRVSTEEASADARNEHPTVFEIWERATPEIEASDEG